VPLRAPGVPARLALTVDPHGTVHVEPGAQTCAPPGCTVMLIGDTTLTALPESGGHFLGWEDGTGSCSDSPTCTFPGSIGTAVVRAKFASANAKAVAITIAGFGPVQAPSRTCTSSCTDYVEPGWQVTLTAGGTFQQWSGDCTGTSSTCNLGTVINDRAVTATFAP
jgi:hypothetical protein